MLKRKLHGVIGLLIAGSLLLSGCGAKTTLKNDTNETFKYTMTVMNSERGTTDVYKELVKKFNIDLEFIPYSNGDWNEKVRIWMATGEMPDIMQADIQNYNMTDYRGWVEQGLVKELHDLSKYPNLAKVKSNLKSAPYFMVNGKNYAWQAPRDVEPGKNFVSKYTFLYRADWAKKLGMEKDEYTWDEFVDLTRAFIKKDPGGNGAGKTLGIVGSNGPFPHFGGLMQMSPYWEQYFIKDGKYVWGMGEQETLEAIKMEKKLYDEGVIWQDILIANSNDGENKFLSGESGIYFLPLDAGAYKRVITTLQKSSPNMNGEEAIKPMYVKAPNGKLWGQKSMDYWSITCFNKNLSDQKLDRILQLFDYVCSEEGLKMYDTVSAYKGSPDPAIANSKAITPFLSNYMVKGFDTAVFHDELVSKVIRDRLKELINKLDSDETVLREYDYDLYFFDSPNYKKYGAFYEEGRKKILQIIGSSTNVEKDWNDWKASVQPKVDLVLEELNSKLLKK